MIPDDAREYREHIVDGCGALIDEMQEAFENADEELDATVLLPLLKQMGDGIGELNISVGVLLAILISKGITSQQEFESIKARISAWHDQVTAEATAEAKKNAGLDGLEDDDGT